MALLGSIFNYYKLSNDQKTWMHEQKISIEKELLFKKLKKRYENYSNIFKLLGNVRDIEYPEEHYDYLRNNKDEIIKTADLILKELYGEAGLFMEYKTRSIILKTYQISYKYADNKVSLEELVDSYYIARRSLRNDLEFDDYSDSKKIKDVLQDPEVESFDLISKEKKSIWAKKDVLASSSRPGYPAKIVHIQTLKDTVEKWHRINIKSVICLLSEKELNTYYNQIDGGLINYYMKEGFNVFCLAVDDFQTPPLNMDELNIINNQFGSLEKPVLIHCGAGQDRTGRAVEFILDLN
ncbi:MAG: hypothetical protein COA46_02810 [Porticoccaceae bacterium]|nr:MAG: hypothetical protein COA46_02810 [Porticoccaceae bacterium]